MPKYAKLTTGLLIAWFAFSLTASAFHLYSTAPNQPPLPIGLAATLPIAVFFAWFAASPSFRQFLYSLDPRTLTQAQSLRVAGLTMLTLYAVHLLPGLFALPAGLGDMGVGLTAVYASNRLARPEHRSGFIRWQFLGIADLVIAVTMGTLVGFLEPHGVPNSLMTVLPMSLIPTFGVPLFVILHIISIAQARRWPQQEQAGNTAVLSPAA